MIGTHTCIYIHVYIYIYTYICTYQCGCDHINKWCEALSFGEAFREFRGPGQKFVRKVRISTCQKLTDNDGECIFMSHRFRWSFWSCHFSISWSFDVGAWGVLVQRGASQPSLRHAGGLYTLRSIPLSRRECLFASRWVCATFLFSKLIAECLLLLVMLCFILTAAHVCFLFVLDVFCFSHLVRYCN